MRNREPFTDVDIPEKVMESWKKLSKELEEAWEYMIENITAEDLEKYLKSRKKKKKRRKKVAKMVKMIILEDV